MRTRSPKRVASQRRPKEPTGRSFVKIALIGLTALLVAGIAIMLPQLVSKSEPPSEVARFDTSGRQQSGSVTYTNYQLVIKAEVDWDSLDDARRQELVEYAFAEARIHIADNGVSNFNIIGISEVPANSSDPGRPLFLYDRENEDVIIYVDGVRAYTIPAPEL
jgi:hypothetical protein